MGKKKPKYFWEESDGCTYRKPTKDELEEALQLKSQIEQAEKEKRKLEKKIQRLRETAEDNRVFYDEAGFIYDIRNFVASGTVDFI